MMEEVSSEGGGEKTATAQIASQLEEAALTDVIQPAPGQEGSPTVQPPADLPPALAPTAAEAAVYSPAAPTAAPSVPIVPPQPSPSQVSSPTPPEMPHTVDLADPPTAAAALSAIADQPSSGLFGWFGSGLVNKVVEKTKHSVESVITTLDPGMKEVIYSGGDVEVVVASEQEAEVAAVREAFQTVFGHASVFGKVCSVSGVAAQPVGYSAGVKGCEERVDGLRQDPAVLDDTVLVAVQHFITDLLPDKWYDVGCVLLRAGPVTQQVFTQATPLPAERVQSAHDLTPPDYPLRWSGLQVPVADLLGGGDWHERLGGVPRRELLYNAAKALATLYKNSL